MSLDGVDLAGLVDAFDSRQILHVGYGDSLDAVGRDGRPLRDRLRELILVHHEDYASVLTGHIGAHVAPFAAGASFEYPVLMSVVASIAAQSELMRAVSKGVVHKNTGSRKVSRLAARLKKLAVA